MVQSTVARSILGTLSGVLDAPQNLARTRGQELVNQQAANQLNAQSYKDLAAEVEQAGNYRVNPTDTSGALFQYDVGKLYEDRPELALRVFNSDPRFNVATDENGRRIQTEISRFITNEDGSISAVVTRPDGREVPLTENRTAQGDDVVVKLSPEDFNKIGTNIFGSIIAKGGGDNASTYLRDMGALTDTLVREQAVNTVAEDPQFDDPALRSNMYAILNKASGEDLNQIASELGIDVPAITAQTQQVEEPAAEPAEGSTRLIKRFMDQSNRLVDLEGDDSNRRDAQRKQQLSRALEGTRTQLEKQREKLLSEISDLESGDLKPDEIRIGTDGRRSRTRSSDPERSIAMRQAEIAEIDALLNPDAAPMAGEDTVLTIGELESKTPPPPVPITSRESIISAIQNNLAEPTQEQYDVMAKYLQDKNVTSVEDLSKIPSKDAHMAVWLASSRQPGSVSDKLAVASQMFNYINTGDLGTSPTELSNVRLRAAEYNRSVSRDTIDSLAAQDEAFNTAVGDLDKVRELLTTQVDRDGNRIATSGELVAPGSEATRTVASIFDKLANYAEGGPNKAAYRKVAMEALLTHMLASANSKKPGFFEFSDRIDKFFNDKGQLRIGNNAIAGLIREEEDGFVFRDPSGGDLNFTIGKQAFRDTYGNQVFSQIEEIARINTQAARSSRSR
jgi:hypothetical protein